MNNVNNPPSGQTASLITTTVTPPANTPAPYNVTFTGLVQGTSRSNSSEAKAWRNNAIYAELRNVLLRAGVTPDADNWAQLQAAIVAIADERIGNLNASAAETIAGTNSTKYISPDDLKATLGSGAAYSLSFNHTYTSGLYLPNLTTLTEGGLVMQARTTSSDGFTRYAYQGVLRDGGVISAEGGLGVNLPGGVSAGVYGVAHAGEFAGHFSGDTKTVGQAVIDAAGANEEIAIVALSVAKATTINQAVRAIIASGTANSNFGTTTTASVSGDVSSGVSVPSGAAAVGVSGTVYSTGSGEKIGVRGESQSAGGYNVGVYGVAANGTTNWAGYFAGNVYYSGSLTASDKRLKENFGEAPDLSGIEIKSFDKYQELIGLDGKTVRTLVGRQTGVIAQDVQEVAPHLVQEGGGFLAVQESSVLFSMIDELRKRVAELEVR